MFMTLTITSVKLSNHAVKVRKVFKDLKNHIQLIFELADAAAKFHVNQNQTLCL